MICIPVDIRPTIIKVSPIIRELKRRRKDFFICHTGQLLSLRPKDRIAKIISPLAKFSSMHYQTDKIFFKQLKVPKPKYNLEIGSGTQAKQVGEALIGLEKVFSKEKPETVLIHGDANMVPAATLAAVKLGITAVHKEAGLRSYNRKMPEEFNRIIADHTCDWLFTPTEHSKKILLKEGIEKERIFVTGNTIVDAVNYNIKISENIPLDIPEEFILFTLHRAENVDDNKVLKIVMSSIKLIIKEFELPVIWPIHPRTKLRLIRSGLYISVKFNRKLKMIDPIGYFEFLKYLNHSKLVLTDSGGVQEEACTLHIPCVTLRTETERPESVMVGANIVAGVTNSRNILKSAKKMIEKKRKWKNPFGDGKAAARIVKLISKLV